MKKCPICKKPTFILKGADVNKFIPPEHKKYFAVRDFKYSILKCGSCGLEFQDPMPGDDVLKGLYSKSYANPRASKEIVELNAKKNIKLLAKYGLTKKTKLLDFGCGDNHFVKAGGGSNWIGWDKYLAPVSRDKNYEFITLWGVLEHVTDPIGVMKDVRGMMAKKGLVVITTVFNEFSQIPYNHKPPEHTFYYTQKSIRELFKRTGFKVLEYSPYWMWQKPEIYFWCIFNSSKMPEKIRRKVKLNFKGNVFVPTNEIFVVGEKT